MSNVSSLRFISQIGFVLCLLLPVGAFIGVLSGWLELLPGGLLFAAGIGIYVVSVICDALAEIATDVYIIKRQFAGKKQDKPEPKDLAPDAPATPEIIRPPRPKIHNDASDDLTEALYSRRWQGGKAQRAVRKKVQ